MTVPCKVCRHPIEVGAEICSECSSYQDWTRYLFRWKDVIVAIAALAPLWVGAQALRELVGHKPEADIRVLSLQCDAVGLKVAAANLGTAAGIVGPAALKFITSAGLTDPGIELKATDASNADTVLAPAANRVFLMKPYIQGATPNVPYPKVGKPCIAVVDFAFLGFDGSRKSGKVACPCP